MRLVIRDALRLLCVKVGWSYAVFWRTVALQEQRYLIWEDGYCGGNPSGMSGFEAMDLFIKEKGLRASRGEGCLVEPEHPHPTEDRIYMLVHKRMATQVHIEGNGVVGKVALTGIHKWILHNYIDNNCSAFKDLVELNQQSLAGIHTLVVIPVPPLGVVQLGSSQSIFEEVGFVKYVQQLFRESISMTRAHLCDGSTTNLNHMLQLSDSIQSSGIQYGNSRGNMSTSPSLTLHRKEIKPLRGHDTQFITKPSCVFTSPLNKVLVPFQQKSFDNGVKRMMLPSSTFSQSSCHAISNESHNDQLKRVTESLGHPATTGHNLRIMEQDLPYQSAHVNDILSPDHLKFVKNQFKSYHKTRNESADNHAALVGSTESLNLRTDEFILPNSVNDCESASSFGRSGSSNMAVSIGNSAKLSGGIMECVKGIISPDGDILQNPSPTDDLDSIFMVSHDFSWNHSTTTGEKSGTMSSIGKENHGSKICQSLDPVLENDIHSSCDRLTNSSNPDTWWYESGLARLNQQDPPNDFHALANCQNSAYVHNTEMLHSSCIKRISEPHQQYKERGLFDLLGLDQISNFNHSYLDGSFISSNSMGVCDMTTGVPNCTSQIDATTFGDEILCSGGLFSECGNDQLLDAIFSQVKPTCKSISDDNVSCNTALTKMSIISVPNKSLESNELVLSDQLPKHFVGQPSNTDKFHTSIKSECNIDRSGGICTLKEENYISEINQRVGKDRSMKCDIISAVNCRVDEVGKMNKRRVRPGENSRPRPKDRQLIQDRVKELREIVPNGAKMSIDALLEKTIKHMLFLQSVTNLADKLKETGKPKIISKDEGVLLNDNFKGGATWAYEVGNQSVFCPIVVEDLITPRHMLVEMICEKKGFFLEIADSIRGLGLTILKGIMEARDDKVWARFTVEANRDVTRMEVFLYLVHLLEPAAGNALLEGDHSCKNPHEGNAVLEGDHSCKNPHDSPHHSSIPWTGAADCL